MSTTTYIYFFCGEIVQPVLNSVSIVQSAVCLTGKFESQLGQITFGEIHHKIISTVILFPSRKHTYIILTPLNPTFI